MSEKKKPSGIIFAAIMMFLIGAFDLVNAISAFANASWVVDFPGAMGESLSVWGVLELILAVGFFYAGYSILRGGKFGLYWGIIFAIMNAAKWFLYIFWTPIAAIVGISIDVLIMWALATNADYFE